jgi:hypothetical protein
LQYAEANPWQNRIRFTTPSLDSAFAAAVKIDYPAELGDGAVRRAIAAGQPHQVRHKKADTEETARSGTPDDPYLGLMAWGRR